MTNFITDSQFENCKQLFSKTFEQGIQFEKNPFIGKYMYYRACEFNFILHEDFFDGIRKLVSDTEKENRIIFYPFSPDPKQYYDEHKYYNIFEIGNDSSEKEINEVLMTGKDISMIDLCDEITYFPYQGSWAIIGSRYWDMAIIGFTEEKNIDEFISLFPEWGHLFDTVEGCVIDMNERFSFEINVLQSYFELVKNYEPRL